VHLLDPERLPQYLARLFRTAWALCGSADEAEDLVQETCARVLARPRLLRGEDDLAYLMRVLHNTFISTRRTASRRPQQEPLEKAPDPVDERMAARPHEAVEARRVYGAIAELRHEYRDVLVAVDLAGLTYREAAQALGLPEGTVMSRLYRARRQITRALDANQPSRTSRESAPRPSRTRG
jgi:RNA polymerase sigma-70 factor (ECF subfamily)